MGHSVQGAVYKGPGAPDAEGLPCSPPSVQGRADLLLPEGSAAGGLGGSGVLLNNCTHMAKCKFRWGAVLLPHSGTPRT